MPVNYEPAQIQGSTSFTPILLGATDNPNVTYTKQIGLYRMVGKRCVFDIEIVTSNITKATLTDAIRVSLPAFAASSPPITRISNVQAENAIPVRVGTSCYIIAGDNFLTLKQSSSSLLGDLTYALLTGIGILTNVITIRVGGSFETP
jgi:hypothetical protein